MFFSVWLKDKITHLKTVWPEHWAVCYHLHHVNYCKISWEQDFQLLVNDLCRSLYHGCWLSSAGSMWVAASSCSSAILWKNKNQQLMLCFMCDKKSKIQYIYPNIFYLCIMKRLWCWVSFLNWMVFLSFIRITVFLSIRCHSQRFILL